MHPAGGRVTLHLHLPFSCELRLGFNFGRGGTTILVVVGRSFWSWRHDRLCWLSYCPGLPKQGFSLHIIFISPCPDFYLAGRNKNQGMAQARPSPRKENQGTARARPAPRKENQGMARPRPAPRKRNQGMARARPAPRKKNQGMARPAREKKIRAWPKNQGTALQAGNSEFDQIKARPQLAPAKK